MCESVHAGQWGERPVATSCPPSITSEPLPVFSLSPSVCFCLRLMNSDWDICTFHKPWLRLSPLCVFFTVFEVEVGGGVLHARWGAAALRQQLLSHYQQSLGFYVCPPNTERTPPGPNCWLPRAPPRPGGLSAWLLSQGLCKVETQVVHQTRGQFLTERRVSTLPLWREKKKVLCVLSAVAQLLSPVETFLEFISKQFEVSFRISLVTLPENAEVMFGAFIKNIIKWKYLNENEVSETDGGFKNSLITWK